jgi:hypothetical protein
VVVVVVVVAVVYEKWGVKHLMSGRGSKCKEMQVFVVQFRLVSPRGGRRRGRELLRCAKDNYFVTRVQYVTEDLARRSQYYVVTSSLFLRGGKVCRVSRGSGRFQPWPYVFSENCSCENAESNNERWPQRKKKSFREVQGMTSNATGQNKDIKRGRRVSEGKATPRVTVQKKKRPATQPKRNDG